MYPVARGFYSFWQYKDNTDIRGGFSGEMGVKRQCDARKRQIITRMTY